MRGKRGLRLVYWVLAVLPLVAAAIAWPRIPDEIAVASGLVVSTGRNGIFLMPAINLLFGGVFDLASGRMLRAMDERSKGPGGPPDGEPTLLALKAYMMAVLSAVCLCVVYGYYTLDGGDGTAALMGRVLAVLLGVGELLTAMYLPRATKWSILSLRWSYTEKSENVWFKTHWLGTRLLAPAGAAGIGSGLAQAGLNAFLFAAAILVLVMISLYLYSKRLYEDEFFK